MSLKQITPCDFADANGEHHCPYADEGAYVDCEWYCSADPEDGYVPEEE